MRDARPPPPPSCHTVSLPSGSPVRYALRSLAASPGNSGLDPSSPSYDRSKDEDILRWTEFCADVFSYKPSPPGADYFARHFYSDPRSDASLVRVMMECDGDGSEVEVASSVRVFRRVLSLGGGGGSDGAIEAGGIGEVCTHPNHQRRGLAKLLLKDAVDIMRSSATDDRLEEGGRMRISLLHAAPEFRPVYAKAGGYRSVRSGWSEVRVDASRLSEGRSSPRIRRAAFPRDGPRLRDLHRGFSERRLVTVVRTAEYWNEYVSAELGDTLLVLEDDGTGEIKAWMSIRRRGGRYQLREFGMDLGKNSRDGEAAPLSSSFAALFGACLEAEADGGVPSAEPRAGPGECDAGAGHRVVMPTFLVGDLHEERIRALAAAGGGKDADDGRRTRDLVDFWDGVDAADGGQESDGGRAEDGAGKQGVYTTSGEYFTRPEPDDGWMYVGFDGAGRSAVDSLAGGDGGRPHLIWPTDSF